MSLLLIENSALVASNRLLQEAGARLLSAADCRWHVHAQCTVCRYCHCRSVMHKLYLLLF